MENIILNLSHEVSDLYFSKKKYTFDPKLIIPLKHKLFQQAVKRDGNVYPCKGNHFHVDEDKLVFWYNDEYKSTKMTKIKIK